MKRQQTEVSATVKEKLLKNLSNLHIHAVTFYYAEMGGASAQQNRDTQARAAPVGTVTTGTQTGRRNGCVPTATARYEARTALGQPARYRGSRSQAVSG